MSEASASSELLSSLGPASSGTAGDRPIMADDVEAENAKRLLSTLDFLDTLESRYQRHTNGMREEKETLMNRIASLTDELGDAKREAEVNQRRLRHLVSEHWMAPEPQEMRQDALDILAEPLSTSSSAETSNVPFGKADGPVTLAFRTPMAPSWPFSLHRDLGKTIAALAEDLEASSYDVDDEPEHAAGAITELSHLRGRLRLRERQLRHVLAFLDHVLDQRGCYDTDHHAHHSQPAVLPPHALNKHKLLVGRGDSGHNQDVDAGIGFANAESRETLIEEQQQKRDSLPNEHELASELSDFQPRRVELRDLKEELETVRQQAVDFMRIAQTCQRDLAEAQSIAEQETQHRLALESMLADSYSLMQRMLAMTTSTPADCSQVPGTRLIS